MARRDREKNRAEKKQILLEYLGNPDNPFPTREFLSTDVLGYKQPETIYQIFTPHELDLINNEALDIRRTRYASRISEVDLAMIKAAAEGDATAAKLIYQRIENWAPTNKNLNQDITERKPLGQELDEDERAIIDAKLETIRDQLIEAQRQKTKSAKIVDITNRASGATASAATGRGGQ